jgi:hypothetical protein
MTHPESQSGSPTRTPASLNAKLNKGLVAYVAAAGAAGVGMLAGVRPADAEVVYTPANTPLLINTPVALDLNNDGTVDFELSNNYLGGLAKSCTICTFFEHASLKVNPAQAGNAIWEITAASHHSSRLRLKRERKKERKNRVEEVAAPVPWGVVVGPERKLESAPMVMDSANFMYSYSDHFSYNSIGDWGKGRQFAGSYLGLKFTAGGEVHYGWARITVHANKLAITATLTGYAYETVPNRGIITGLEHGTFDDSAEMDPVSLGETMASNPSLGRLAQGATGLAAWRASQTAAQNAAPASGK